MSQSKALNKEEKIKCLFIARTYPPLVGGMERFASDFYRFMGQKMTLRLIANSIGKKHIFQFFFKVLFYCVFNAHKFDLIHLNDAILSPLIPAIRLFSRTKITVTVHGLDIVYRKYGYQHLVLPFLRMADRIFPVSRYTKEQCLFRGIRDEKLHVIPNGLDFSSIHHCNDAEICQFIEDLGITLAGKICLLSLGRLIERKGHVWFIEQVFTELPENYLYFIAGDGSEFERIAATVNQLSLDDRVILLGYVPDTVKTCLFEIADLFIMPNISDQDDQEGFGIVLLEAGSHNLPSIASNIEGIKDAILDGVSGVLVNEKDAQGFLDAITQSDINREEISQHLQEAFDWQKISQRYLAEFKKLVSS